MKGEDLGTSTVVRALNKHTRLLYGLGLVTKPCPRELTLPVFKMCGRATSQVCPYTLKLLHFKCNTRHTTSFTRFLLSHMLLTQLSATVTRSGTCKLGLAAVIRLF